jgi:hypothetical protein
LEIETAERLKMVKNEALLLHGILHARLPQIVENNVDERASRVVPFSCGLRIRALGVRRQYAMRGETLDSKWAGDADALGILVRLIVEKLGLRPQGNRIVDCLLPCAAKGPPFPVDHRCFRSPILVRFARDLPIFPLLVGESIQLLAHRFQFFLVLCVNCVNLVIVRDRFEGDVRNAFIDKSLLHVIVGLRITVWYSPRELCFLFDTFGRIRKGVERIAACHEASSGKCKRHATRIRSNPAAAPLFRDEC